LNSVIVKCNDITVIATEKSNDRYKKKIITYYK